MNSEEAYSAVLFLALTAALVFAYRQGRRRLFDYLIYAWFLSFCAALSVWIGFTAANWSMALFSFWLSREFFSMIDLRIQDRWGVLGGYFSIPFMFVFIQMNWYGTFIISIPVYAFLIVPLLIALACPHEKGATAAIGAIHFGLFLCVFCIGHMAYLLSLSPGQYVMVVATVAVCDLIQMAVERTGLTPPRRAGLRIALSILASESIQWAFRPATGLPWNHLFALGALIPILAELGRTTLKTIAEDLGAEPDGSRPGHGRILNGVKSFLYAGPVVFHYLWYFIY